MGRHILPVEQDPETGEYILNFNEEILKETGWREGDTLVWKDLGNGEWSITKKETEENLYLVETVSIFRHRYAVRARSLEHAYDSVTMGEVNELSQQHIDENIVSGRKITQEEYLAIFDQDNDYLQSWTEEQKLQPIYTVNYQD
jgi:hypothetical protein